MVQPADEQTGQDGHDGERRPPRQRGASVVLGGEALAATLRVPDEAARAVLSGVDAEVRAALARFAARSTDGLEGPDVFVPDNDD